MRSKLRSWEDVSWKDLKPSMLVCEISISLLETGMYETAG